MSASNLSPTFPGGSSRTWITTSHFRRRGFVHRRLFLCRRGTNLPRHSLFFSPPVCIFLQDFAFSQIWDNFTGLHPVTFCSPGTHFWRTALLITPLSECRFNWQPDPFVPYSWPVRWHGCQPWFLFFFFLYTWGILFWGVLHFCRWWKHTRGVYYKAKVTHFSVHT